MDAWKWFNTVLVTTPLLLLYPPTRHLPSGKKLLCMDDRDYNTRQVPYGYQETQHARSRSNRGRRRESTALGNVSSDEHNSSSSGSSDTSHTEGYDSEGFVPPVDAKYICPICLHVLRKPVQTECGHRFCRNCIKRWLRSRGRPECPVCNDPVTEDRLYPDNFANREILNFNVRCSNSKEGCESRVELHHLESHLQKCDFSLTACPNSCQQMVLRKNLNDHLANVCSLRQTTCSQCQQKILVDKQQHHLDRECPDMYITCNFCSQHILRKEYSSHTKQMCTKAPVDCEFKSVGCTDEVRREDLASHSKQEIEKHMRYLLNSIKGLYRLIRTSPHATAALPGLLEGDTPIDPDQLRTWHSSVPSEGNEYVLDSEGYFTAGSSLSVATPSVAGFSHTSMSSGLSMPTIASSEGASADTTHHSGNVTVTHPHTDKTPSGFTHSSHLGAFTAPIRDFPGTARVALAQLDRVVGEMSLEQPRPFSLPSSISSGSVSPLDRQLRDVIEENRKQAETISKQEHSILELQGKMRLLEHRLNVQVSKNHEMKETMVDLEARLCHGVYVWRIDNFRQKRQDAIQGLNTVLHSSGFYTSMYGYKICVRVNPNGIESASSQHISLFIHFMKGKYDNVVEWPFRGQITLSILDQCEEAGFRQHITETLQANPAIAAFQRPTSHRNHKGFGYMEFAPIAVLENTSGTSCFIKDDTLIIKAIVKE